MMAFKNRENDPLGTTPRKWKKRVWMGLLVSLFFLGAQQSSQAESPFEQSSITDRKIDWPNWNDLKRLFLFRDYNTRVVVVGTTLLGCAAGMIGSFTLLRKRALMGDALSHATLPGIGIAFMLATSMNWDGKSLPVLLTGAGISGLLGVASILFIRHATRLKEDTALGIVLSVFYGAGVAILSVSQQMKTGHAAGLESFIYGKTASMVVSDAQLIGGAGLICVLTGVFLFKELKLLCFDEAFSGSRGYPVLLLDMILMGMVVIVTIVGLQAVGLVLMIALLVIPAAAARFWTEDMLWMAWISSCLGGVSAMVGAAMSAVLPKLPSGAMIVLVSAFTFLVSMILGVKRGVLIRWFRRYSLNRRMDRQHLLRGMYEYLEDQVQGEVCTADIAAKVPFSWLHKSRSWSATRLRQEISRAQRAGQVEYLETNYVRLTESGLETAARLTHQHRLWELYLVTHAEVATSHVDRDADAIEHVLEPEMIDQLERLLDKTQATQGVAPSPHDIRVFGSQLKTEVGER